MASTEGDWDLTLSVVSRIVTQSSFICTIDQHTLALDVHPLLYTTSEDTPEYISRSRALVNTQRDELFCVAPLHREIRWVLSGESAGETTVLGKSTALEYSRGNVPIGTSKGYTSIEAFRNDGRFCGFFPGKIIDAGR